VSTDGSKARYAPPLHGARRRRAAPCRCHRIVWAGGLRRSVL